MRSTPEVRALARGRILSATMTVFRIPERRRLDAQQIKAALADRAAEIGVRLFGEPNRALSSRTTIEVRVEGRDLA